MGGIAVIALSAGFLARHLWPSPPVSSATVTFRPQIVDVPAPRRLIVTKYLVQAKESVKKGQPIYEAYVSDSTLDEAIAVIRLRETIEDMRRANGGKETATIKQFRQKIAFSEQMMRRGGRLRTFNSPTDGLVATIGTATPETIPTKTPVLRLARFQVLSAATVVDAQVDTGSNVILSNWRPSFPGKTQVILSADRDLSVANPSHFVQAVANLGKEFDRVEIKSRIETKNSTSGALIAVNVDPSFETSGRVRAYELVRQTLPIGKHLEAVNRELVGHAVTNANGAPRTIAKAAQTSVVGYRRREGKGGTLEITVVDPPARLRQMAEAWWRAGIPIQADMFLPNDQPKRPEM